MQMPEKYIEEVTTNSCQIPSNLLFSNRKIIHADVHVSTLLDIIHSSEIGIIVDIVSIGQCDSVFRVK
jgi:hypothetical protein